MVNRHESSTRLAELIWRTVKLRVSLLAISIISLLVVWSGLLTGNQEALNIDASFCRTLVAQRNDFARSVNARSSNAQVGQPRSPDLASSPEGVCTDSFSRKFIEINRFLDQSALLGAKTPDDSANFFKETSAEYSEFAGYDARRLAAYRMRVKLSSAYSGSSVEANTLSVAGILPFCVLAVLAVFFILGFQEQSYRRQLKIMLSLGASDDGDSGLDLAKTQFFAPRSPSDGHKLTRFFVQSPEGIAAGTLLLAVFLLLFEVISAFIAGLLHLTDTIFGSYPFKLYLAAWIFVLVLFFTRQSYLPPRATAGRRRLFPVGLRWQRLADWGSIVLVFVSFASFCLPWAASAGGELKRGYEFVLRNRVQLQIGNIRLFDIDPRIFSEIRVQLWVSIFFLVVCGLDAAFDLRRVKVLAKAVYYARVTTAVVVVFLAVNYLIYMAILQYESVAVTPWMGDVLPSLGRSMGASMMDYNPTGGFWIFLVSSFGLVLISLSGGHAELSAVRQTGDEAA